MAQKQLSFLLFRPVNVSYVLDASFLANLFSRFKISPSLSSLDQATIWSEVLWQLLMTWYPEDISDTIYNIL